VARRWRAEQRRSRKWSLNIKSTTSIFLNTAPTFLTGSLRTRIGLADVTGFEFNRRWSRASVDTVDCSAGGCCLASATSRLPILASSYSATHRPPLSLGLPAARLYLSTLYLPSQRRAICAPQPAFRRDPPRVCPGILQRRCSRSVLGGLCHIHSHSHFHGQDFACMPVAGCLTVGCIHGRRERCVRGRGTFPVF
jgi:hypothetical protein